MCGIFGVIRPNGVTRDDSDTFDAIGIKLKHRGPDGDGHIRVSRALLGMHRLSIIDIDHGWQPFWSEDGQIGVLGNGEIYNANELREGLIRRGHTFTSHSDIEVVAHLFEESGIQCANFLRGMFALVILDKKSSVVVLIRDRLGEKPLSYTEQNGAFYFSSEQTPLVKTGVVPLRIDYQVLPQYLLHGFVPEPRSIIEGINKVPAAHAMSISLDDGSTKLTRYWNSLDYIDDKKLTDQDLALAIEDAVVVATASDVPIGVALSGGLDSSMIAAIAAKVRPDLQAFTIDYDEPGFSEAKDAAAFSRELGISCHVTTLNTQTIAEQFGEICAMRDEPISDIAGPALAALPRAAHASGVPVLLTGVGGDELFWGYEWIRHLAAWTTSFTAANTRSNFLQRSGLTSPPSTTQGITAWLISGGGLRTQRDLVRFLNEWRTHDSVPLPLYEFQYGYRRIIKLIANLTEVSPTFPAPEFFGTTSADTKAAEYTWASNETYLRVNSLTQIDRLAMHFSVESRTPFADHLLVQKVMSERIGTQRIFEPTKSQQRAIAMELLPKHIIDRPKRGFTPPVRKWAKAIWKVNPAAVQATALTSVSNSLGDRASKLMTTPVDALGRVDQMSMRLMTLELWLQGME